MKLTGEEVAFVFRDMVRAGCASSVITGVKQYITALEAENAEAWKLLSWVKNAAEGSRMTHDRSVRLILSEYELNCIRSFLKGEKANE